MKTTVEWSTTCNLLIKKNQQYHFSGNVLKVGHIVND